MSEYLANHNSGQATNAKKVEPPSRPCYFELHKTGTFLPFRKLRAPSNEPFWDK